MRAGKQQRETLAQDNHDLRRALEESRRARETLARQNETLRNEAAELREMNDALTKALAESVDESDKMRATLAIITADSAARVAADTALLVATGEADNA